MSDMSLYECYKSIASSILLQAYKDYRALLRGKLKEDKEVNVKELNKFFQSNWFENLCDIAGIDSELYIEQIVQICEDCT